MPENAQWEYRVLTTGSVFKAPKSEEVEALLNELGQDGWELVSAHGMENSNRLRLVLKRPMTSRTRRERGWPG